MDADWGSDGLEIDEAMLTHVGEACSQACAPESQHHLLTSSQQPLSSALAPEIGQQLGLQEFASFSQGSHSKILAPEPNQRFSDALSGLHQFAFDRRRGSTQAVAETSLMPDEVGLQQSLSESMHALSPSVCDDQFNSGQEHRDSAQSEPHGASVLAQPASEPELGCQAVALSQHPTSASVGPEDRQCGWAGSTKRTPSAAPGMCSSGGEVWSSQLRASVARAPATPLARFHPRQAPGAPSGGGVLVPAPRSSEGWASASSQNAASWAAADAEPRVSRRKVDVEEMLIAQCRQEGPPGPASATLAVVGSKAGCLPRLSWKGSEESAAASAFIDSVAWLSALKSLKLPFDRFHLGLGSLDARAQGRSPMMTHNLAALAQGVWTPRRWHLVVLVRRVELVAGEITAQVVDPTGEAVAVVHRRVPKAWPHATTEGAVLLLTNVRALPSLSGPSASVGQPVAGERPRLLVMEQSLGRCFASGDVGAQESAALLAEARASLSA